MQVVYDMGNGMRMVDLSKLVDPATETRRCKLYRFNTGGPIPDFHTNFDIMSHLGTHAECPYHHDDNWPDVTGLPLTTFVGRGVYVDFKDTVAPYTHITKADLDRAAYKVKEGDIVIIDSSYKLEPFTKLTNTEVDKRLLIDAESAEWFRDHKVKAVGFGDGVSIENCNEDVKPLRTSFSSKFSRTSSTLKRMYSSCPSPRFRSSAWIPARFMLMQSRELRNFLNKGV